MTTRPDPVAFRRNVGSRVRWDLGGPAGTILSVRIGSGGWPFYEVAWDNGAPEWWSTTLSCSSRFLRIEPANDETDIPLCACRHSAYVHIHDDRSDTPNYPCLVADCGCADFWMGE